MDPARNFTLENGIGRSGNLKLTYFVTKLWICDINAIETFISYSAMQPQITLFLARVPWWSVRWADLIADLNAICAICRSYIGHIWAIHKLYISHVQPTVQATDAPYPIWKNDIWTNSHCYSYLAITFHVGLRTWQVNSTRELDIPELRSACKDRSRGHPGSQTSTDQRLEDRSPGHPGDLWIQKL